LREEEKIEEAEEIPASALFENPDINVAPNRSTFQTWFESTFSKYRLKPLERDPEKCNKKEKASSEFLYQKFAGAYMSLKTPYRGLLV